MPASLRAPGSSPAPLPVGPILAPTDEAWRAMTPDARERFLSTVNAAIAETRPHEQIKRRVADMLSLQFEALGRVLYVAEAMAVVYPGVEVFSPDVLVVRGVEQPVDDERRAWVVGEEGRGLDLVLEVHHGGRKQVVVDNVERYASLGIPEYFIYDCGAQQIYGYRLASPEARHYQRIESRAAHYHSTVLGLELVVLRGSLRLGRINGELIGSSEKIVRLSERVDHFEAQARHAQAKLDEALATIGEHVLAILAAREIPTTDDIRSRVLACEDLEILQRWLARALVVTCARDVVSP